jgi:siroheme synthase-like protein
MSNNLFPIFLKLDEMHVLLIGAGNVGIEKLNAIINNSPGAKVTVIAKNVLNEFREIALKGNVNIIEEAYDASFITGDITIVIAAVNDVALAETIRNDAHAKGKLINAADKPALCDFYLGSVVTKGDLKLAISTNGKSPTMAKRLREVFSEMLPGELDEVMQNLREIREKLHGDFQHKVAELNRITKTLIEKND